MADRDGKARAPGGGWVDDLKVATAFLSRIPVSAGGAAAPGRLARAARAFPLVGAGLGLLGGLVYAIALGLGLTPTLAAVLALAALVWLTGALHEDALADVADGFGGGTERDEKLRIMRDSRVGSYGALALVVSFALRVAALSALAEPGTVTAALVAAGAASRATMAGLMQRLEPARTEGRAAEAGKPDDRAVALALAIAAVISVLGLGLRAGAGGFLAAGLGAAAVGYLARRQIGGHTGDVLGAGQQAAEILCLLTVVALV